MNRKEFLKITGLGSASVLMLNGCNLFVNKDDDLLTAEAPISISSPKQNEDIINYIIRTNGKFNNVIYKQILGSANEFKEGDETIKVAAINEESRINARKLIENTSIKTLNTHNVYSDDLIKLIQNSITKNDEIENWTLKQLKDFLLTSSEENIKEILPSLSSDIIASVVKLMTNDDLIKVSQKVFNPLPNSKIGSKGYMGARVQPNSPTDNVEDISWQVFNAWSFAVGDVVLGTNPVSSEVESVANIENTLLDIIKTFDLEDTIPNCVLSHIDVQAEVENQNPNTTGIWFQSIAGTVNANKTFDVTIEKMLDYASKRGGEFGFYAETGQGADLTNGHAEGFDMVMHESRKYGFLRVLKQKINQLKGTSNSWVHVNDVAGFIGPEVFRTKEQLVRCCLEDTVMGKLHGLTIGLDICSTLHMDVNLNDLDWCIEQVMPANPAYLMALPTKNDPMLSYLTTAFNNHVKIREQFGYKVNDAMWNFFKEIDIIDSNNKPTKHFGDPIWVYAQYLKRKEDKRSLQQIYEDGKMAIQRVKNNGVPIAHGYGENYWNLNPELEKQVNYLYEDAKRSLWTELDNSFVSSLANSVSITTASIDRKDYIYHPESGEKLSDISLNKIGSIKDKWSSKLPDIQIIISDGLNTKAITDENHLHPYLESLTLKLRKNGYSVSDKKIVITNGRVRAGYACGEILFGNKNSKRSHGIIHIIGERPGSGHHNFSAYLTVSKSDTWYTKGIVDHDISRVVSGISDTALNPQKAASDTVKIMSDLFKKVMNS